MMVIPSPIVTGVFAPEVEPLLYEWGLGEAKELLTSQLHFLAFSCCIAGRVGRGDEKC